jgi:hypothetical protein
MRTILEASRYFKELDSKTALTKNAIRTLVNSGRVPSVQIGNKNLVALEVLEEFLIKGLTVEEEKGHGVIRSIPERIR